MVKITCDVYCSEHDRSFTFAREGSEVFFMSLPISVRITLVSRYGDKIVETNNEQHSDYYKRKIEINFSCLESVQIGDIALVLFILEHKRMTGFHNIKVFYVDPVSVCGADGTPIDINIPRFLSLVSN